MRRWSRTHRAVVAAAAIVAMLAVGVALSSAALDNYRPAVMADSPSAYWRMGEASGSTLTDSAGANNGAYSGGFTLGLAGAPWSDANTAASFNGTTASATAPDANALDFSAGASVELWVRRRASGAFQALVGKPLNGQSKLENYSIWLNTSNRPVAYFGNGTTYAQVSGPQRHRSSLRRWSPGGHGEFDGPADPQRERRQHRADGDGQLPGGCRPRRGRVVPGRAAGGAGRGPLFRGTQ
jgi:hypothetical protein